ncbi:ATP-dependent helicase HrpB [Brevibacillus choshinensis]|uniref:ATP-dependent helicase HrpB n=1 Tax=Brevibacillus choshinensis TaxID=54911 RepID=UPI002E1B3754|nr:ATP-dependent helicase HrpB [Brevibacillus choshinensis]MED4753637.1 ATP-dependent helicase HrpB [Brevibacillus choshinensis]
MKALPIDEILPELIEKLRAHTRAVLVAAPGAGKTTRVPLALRDEPWLTGRRILMLEPRRLAARSSARYMAAALGEQVGQTVGYRVKMDAKVGPSTRIEVITEGVLTRMLQADPGLEDVGLILFDEFHERSLHADLGLALSLQAQSLFREDLRLVVMSATLDAFSVAAMMENAPVIVSEGRVFPVETHYLTRPMEGRLETNIIQLIQQALSEETGDMLVFLPGAGEIRRVETVLRESDLPSSTVIAPLYGALPQEVQDAAIQPGTSGKRKIVLATSIAETSLTVEGVRIVIDSGLMRVPRFSPRTGMTRLETIKVSKASADQRRGRAGRLTPGVCYRMWTLQEDRALTAHTAPEIKEADLTPLALELAAWGVNDPAELSWLDEPPKAALEHAHELLLQLGALDPDKRITSHGRQLAEMALHPRLGHMIQKAKERGLTGMACELAALLGEKDILRGRKAAHDVDLRLRMEALRSVASRGGAALSGHADYVEVDEGACRRIWQEATQLKQAWSSSLQKEEAKQSVSLDAIGTLLAEAYPDRIGQRRGSGKYLLRNGRGAVFATDQPLAYAPYIVAAQLDDQGSDSRIMLAASITQTELEGVCAEQAEEETAVWWEKASQSVRARKRTRLGALILREASVAQANQEAVTEALLSGIASEGLGLLPWNRHARQLQERMLFMHRLDDAWPDVSDDALLETLGEWLGPHANGCKSRDDLLRLSLTSILESMLGWNQKRELDEHAPTHMVVPSGSRVPIDYTNPEAPILAVRLQELFGWKETPRIGSGRIPLTLHLLSPAHRPVQVTRDLANFWLHTYFEVKKDLKGRYPKHYWPDDPLQAIPTNRTRPRS